MNDKMKQVVADYLTKHSDIQIKQFIRDELSVDLSVEKTQPFLWAVYEFGTSLYELRPGNTDRDPQIERLANDAKTGGEFYGEITEFYIGEKGDLRRVGVDELLERLALFQRGEK